MKVKSTKRMLLSSILALAMCFSMLVGTTFAWFTDSVTSASNVIKSGNLDIEVEYSLDGENWKPLDGAKDLFQKDLWEPGHTEVVALRIKNVGSLALKYSASMNIASETIGKNKAGEDIVLSEILTVSSMNMDGGPIGDVLAGTIFTDNAAIWQSSDVTTTSFKMGNVLGENQLLLAGATKYVLVKVDMAESVGNDANHNGTNIPTIEFGINVLASQQTYENDSFGNQYDKDAKGAILVKSAEEAQNVLNALESGSTIQLLPGVNYGTLEISAQVTSVNKKPVIQNNNTEAVDYFTAKYPTGEFVRKLDNITILGAPGAKVDGIKFVTGTHKAPGADGTSTGTIYRWVEINNLVIDGVEFTDATNSGAAAGYISPIFMDLQSVKVNGLTVRNCTLEGNKSNMNFVYAYGSAAKDCTFGVTLNDVVIENNTVSGIARLCELREANNVTIRNNKATNLTRELALLSNNANGAYSGDILVSGNEVDNIATDYAPSNGLFFRVGVGGEANIVVENNVVANSNCVEASFVKVTNHTGTLTVQNNTINN